MIILKLFSKIKMIEFYTIENRKNLTLQDKIFLHPLDNEIILYYLFNNLYTDRNIKHVSYIAKTTIEQLKSDLKPIIDKFMHHDSDLLESPIILTLNKRKYHDINENYLNNLKTHFNVDEIMIRNNILIEIFDKIIQDYLILIDLQLNPENCKKFFQKLWYELIKTNNFITLKSMINLVTQKIIEFIIETFYRALKNNTSPDMIHNLFLELQEIVPSFK